MDNSLPERLELRQRMHVRSHAQRRLTRVLGILAAWLTLFVAALVYWKLSALGLGWGQLFHQARDNFAKRPLDGAGRVLMLLALLLHGFYMMRARRYERLILTPQGISYRSPMPGFLQGIHASWSLRWDQVRGVSLTAMTVRLGPQGPVLVLDGGGRKHRIAPLLWVIPGQFPETSPLKEWRRLTGRRPYIIDAAIDDSPVMRYIAQAAPNLKIRRGANIGGMSFALERSPRTLVVVIAFFAFAGYALIDGLFVRSEVYADPPLYAAYLTAAILVSVLTGVWLRRSAVPVLESSVLAVLLGVAVGAAAYPGALRINAMTDRAGLRTYRYARAAAGRYVPLRPNLPTLSFSGSREYWAQFAPGSMYEFQLRKGGLDFYQLNLRPVNAAMRAYYRRRP